MTRTLWNSGRLDESAYQKADKQFKLAKRHLPSDAVQALAQEVVRRLAFRMPRTSRKEELPTQTEIEILCAALLSKDDAAGDRIILAARRDGVGLQTIYLGYIAGAARHLGQMWEEDSISFVEVTLATGRLYRIIRGLRHIIGPTITRGRDALPALFALVPGETHTLGIEMASDLFRREGWDLELAIGLSYDELIARADTHAYQVVVLAAHSNRMIEPLTRLTMALRISLPLAQIVVAGNVVDDTPDIAELVGADAVISDIETAVATLRAILDDAAE